MTASSARRSGSRDEAPGPRYLVVTMTDALQQVRPESGRTVAVHRGAPSYPASPPFHPSERFPEYGDGPLATEPNAAYAAVREALRLLGLDAARHGTAGWNPLGTLVRPGDTVVLKPNLISQWHRVRHAEWVQVITHGSVIRAVLDYVLLALAGRGRVVICDGPQTDSDFGEIVRRTGLDAVAAWGGRGGVDVQLLDLRRDRWYQEGDITHRREPLPGDPAGYTTVELGADSEFADYALSGRFYGADYDIAETARFHNRERHAYVLCRTVMDADVVINIPKLKTHKKTGITVSLKNLVGINGYRNCLPHHTLGTPDQRGDEFPTSDLANRVQSGGIIAFKRLLARLGGGGAWARAVKRVGRAVFGDTQQVVRSGNWHGNDTTWRMVLDLNRCLFHFDGTGARRQRPLRYLSVVDGLIAGDGNGPEAPDPVEAGLVVAGHNPLAVDTVCATLMGFDWRRLRMLARGWTMRALGVADFGPDDVRIAASSAAWSGTLASLQSADTLHFRPHFGWRGAVELRGEARSA